MAGAEMFSVLAVLEARDKISEQMERANSIIDKFTESLGRMGEVAEESGTVTDDALLKTASGADAVELADARLAAAQSKVAKATQEQAASELDLLDVQQKMAAGEMDAAEGANKQAIALTRLQDAEKKVAAASREAAAAQKTQAETSEAAAAKTDEAAAGQDALGASAEKTGGAMGMASKIALGAGAAVAAIGYESIKAATSYQTLTMRLVTSAGESASKLAMVRQGILNISTATGSSANELATSMYTVESAGYHGSAGLDVLKAATEGAKDEGAEFSTVANGVTDALKDFHEPASQSANITSQLVKAVSYGKTTFEQFSRALSNVLPLAGAMHLKLSDVSGVLAEMTSHGVTAQRASQNIANAMRSLENPTKVMEGEFSRVGISADDVQKHLSTQGLGGTMQWLSGLAKDNASRLGQTYPAALAKLMGTSAGLSVALMTTGENAKDTQGAIKGIAGASADAHGNVEGFSKIQQTLAFKLDQAKNAIHNTGIAIGTMLLPAVTKLMGIVNKIIMPIAQWIEKHQKLTGLIFASVGAMLAAAGAIKLVSIAMTLFNAVLDANPIGLVIIAVAGLVAIFMYCWDHFKGFRDFWKAAWSDIKNWAEDAWHFIEKCFDGIVGAGKSVLSWLKDNWHLLLAILTGPIGIAVYLIMHYWNQISGAFKDAYHAVVGTAESLVGFVAKLPGRILGALGNLGGMLFNAGANIIRGLINGIGSMIGAVGNAISGVVNEVKAHLPWSPAKKGPLSGRGSPIIGGQNIVRQLAQGIQAAQPLVTAAMEAVTSGSAAHMHLTTAATSSMTSQVVGSLTSTAGLVGNGAGGGTTIVIDVHDNHVMSDADINALASKIGKALPKTLATGGVRLQPR